MLKPDDSTEPDRASRTARPWAERSPGQFSVGGRSSGMGETAENTTWVVLRYGPPESTTSPGSGYENELGSVDVTERPRDSHGTLAEGDTVEEFVSKGCGVPVGVTLRIEHVEGGAEIGDVTAINVRPRD